jgi:hypothetical protein
MHGRMNVKNSPFFLLVSSLTDAKIYYQNNISNAALNYTAICNKLKHDKKLDIYKPSLIFNSIRAFGTDLSHKSGT